jgi:hypothetical protein
VKAEHPVDELRKLDPASLKVTLMDGSERPVAVPKIRNRWQRVYQVLDAMAWTRIEALDKNGAVLGVLEDDEAAEELVDAAGGGERDLAMAKVLLEVMRSTQKETRQMFETQMRGQAELVEALIAGVKSIASSYETSMQVERATRVAEAAGSGTSPEIMAMLQLAMGSMARGIPAPSNKPEGKP